MRRLRQFPVTSRERVTEVVPGERLGYQLLSGLPLEKALRGWWDRFGKPTTR